MPIDITIPKDNDLISTFPAAIREARTVVAEYAAGDIPISQVTVEYPIGDATVISAEELVSLVGVTSSVQAQIDSKEPTKGVDDNYVTGAEKTKLANLSGTNTGDQDLSGYSTIVHNHNLNNLAEKSYNSLTDKPTIPSVSGLLDETAHDALDHTGLTGIPAAYTLPTASTSVLGGVKIDGTTILISDGVISSTGGSGGGVTDHGLLTGLADDDHSQYLNETRHDALDHTGLTGIPTQYTDEMAQDAVGAAIAAGTQTGITVAYDDVTNKIDFTVTASGAGDVTGPASSVDSNFALFNGTTGKVIKDGGVKASDFATASHNHTSVYEPANANIQSHISSTSNQHPATSITNTPAGNISATTVQAAINELDTEKAAVTQLHDAVTVADSTSIDLTLTGQQLSAAAIFGTTAGTISEGNHGHSGVYEPADATILKDADIGVTVQAYDADLTSWAGIAPSTKQDTLVSGTNIKTINSTSLLGSGDISISVAVSDGDKGDITVSGSGATWTVDVKDPYGFFKSDAASVAFIKTGAGTLSIKAGTYALVATSMVSFSTATAIAMPTHTIGTDYYIYACTDGTVRADANASAPTGYDTSNSRKIGGYHYGRVRNSLTVTDVANEIVPRSLWDLTYRPKCNPAGMVDVYGNGSLWADIYMAAVDSAITLISGAVTAGTCKSIYNGTPLSGTEGLHGYNFIELAKNSGKRLLTHSEWLAVAHGSPQGNDGDNLNAWSATTNSARTGTGQVARAVSFCGACDCVGNLWEWLDEWSNDYSTAIAAAWYNPMTGQNVGQQYLYNSTGLRMYLGGGNWSSGVIAGSRALTVASCPWSVNTGIGSRFACGGL